MMHNAFNEPIQGLSVEVLVGNDHSENNIVSNVGTTDHEGTFLNQPIPDFCVEFVQVNAG
tara:strand:- start:168 stop:347 length:180 start_codon:yes stop_codon:yes gene_type:complete